MRSVASRASSSTTENDMQTEVGIVAVTDDAGRLLEPDLLRAAEAVHRQLRPTLAEDYVARLSEIFAAGGRMVVATRRDAVVGVALWRVVENTYEGRRLYVDDLVSDESFRSAGVGRRLLAWLEARACNLGCDVLALDSGVQRARAHAFYFREGMSIPSFSFRKVLK